MLWVVGNYGLTVLKGWLSIRSFRVGPCGDNLDQYIFVVHGGVRGWGEL